MLHMQSFFSIADSSCIASSMNCLAERVLASFGKHDLAEIMDESRDSLRYYNLGTKYSSKIEHRGRQQHLPVDDVMML